jgi:uncharacterized membrane protein YcjF (UPF0283 family)
MDNDNIACQIAQQRYKGIALWRNLWTILVFIFGVAVIIFLVTAIIFLIREDWLPAALNVIGTIVDGAAITWVVARRNQAVEEEKEAYELVTEKCGDSETVDEYVKKLYLFGRLR